MDDARILLRNTVVRTVLSSVALLRHQPDPGRVSCLTRALKVPRALSGTAHFTSRPLLRFTLHPYFPHSVALMQLRFASFVVINLRRDLHPQDSTHAGRTMEKAPHEGPCLFESG